MKIPFTNIKVTPREQLGVAALAVAGWTSFCMAFSSAPALFTLAAIPATTALAVGVVKGVKAVGRFVTEKLEDYADSHPGSFADNYLVPAFQPTFGPDERDEHEIDSDNELDADELQGLTNDLGERKFYSYTQPTLTNMRERAVRYKIEAADDADYNRKEEGVTRSGRSYR